MVEPQKGARSPESYEREIRSLETRLSEECANSYRLAQELSEAKADGVFVGIVDEYGSVWSGEPGASELIGLRARQSRCRASPRRVVYEPRPRS